MVLTEIMDLPDGRELAWTEVGAREGPPVFFFHGTPGSRRQACFDERPIVAAGVRLVAPDRPGYGHSTYQPGRSLTGWTGDVARLADHLGIDRFAVVGQSGGGPHALACAFVLSTRVTAAGVVSGVGPLESPGSEGAMMPVNQLIVRLARRSQYLAYPLFALFGIAMRRWPERALTSGNRQLPPSDVEVLQRPWVRQGFIDEYRRASSTTALSAAQDFHLFCRDWGFGLEEVTVPVHLWQGDVDRNVPMTHGRVQAEMIPHAQMRVCPGEGHMLVFDHLEEILRAVTS
jgi:pimeloyl-ACP methyl ester carboxylesterase